MIQMTFGLDIGIASVGWAVLSEERIIDLGVRCFDKAETAEKGESLNLARRQARLLRRRLQRRAWRLTKLARVLRQQGLIPSSEFFKQCPDVTDSVWQLRVAGLDRLLTSLEWARVIYHLCKHRGFHWISKAEEARAESDSEGGRVKKGLDETRRRMQERGYRSAAEMLLSEFPNQPQRNKQGNYDKALSRVLLDQELALLFATQRRLGHPHAGTALETLIRGDGLSRSGLFWQQKPALSGEDLLKMLGRCTFERSEYRAPKSSFSAERHVWLTRLNNLRLVVDGESRALNATERQTVLQLPYTSGEKYTYKNLRSALVKQGLLTEAFRFGGLHYPSEAAKDQAKDPEEQILIKLPAWHELRLAFKRAKLDSAWQQISTPALEGHPEMLDQIGWVLSVYKDDGEIAKQLRELPLPVADVDKSACLNVLQGIRFDKFSNLSLKALRQIVPLMEGGLRYDEAVAQIPAYGHHSQPATAPQSKTPYLPTFYEGRRCYASKTDRVGSMQFRADMEVPRNPVVLRALNQARKVVNALIREHGSPTAVHIEMARDLSRPLDERKKVKKAQEQFRDIKQAALDDFESDYGYKPKAAAFEKWMLYREQNGQCAYSQQALDLQLVLSDTSYAQVDHALPYSRSFDDSKNNKVLVLTKENQDKGNRTPFEYLTSFPGGESGDRWRQFVAWVNSTKSYRMAKRNRLLRKNYGPDEAQGFRERNLNDTRYICRFFKNYVEQHLQLAARNDGQTNRRCVVVNGQLTAFLRARWGLLKDRERSDRHHALDAAVVAACSPGMVKALADHARRKEVEFLKQGFPDPETGEILSPAAHARVTRHFPEPWSHFRHELQCRLHMDDRPALREALAQLGTYDAHALAQARPLFVSRAVQRRNGGAVHKETIYAQGERYLQQVAGGMATQKVTIEKTPLTRLTLKDLDHLADPHRNERLYLAIRSRLEEFEGKADKAFGPSNPLFKPGKDGGPSGPQVRSVKLVHEKMSGLPVRGGVAKNDSMLRVDVFSKGGKFYLVPVYVHHRVTGLPNRAIIGAKDEAEWTVMDHSFDFNFSIYPNDFVRIVLRNEVIEGYFSGADRSTGAISLWRHDRDSSFGKGGLYRSIGVRTAINLAKFNVDVLGHLYPATTETRRGLA
jgi:CRISPR-associated endonuclease Csn1